MCHDETSRSFLFPLPLQPSARDPPPLTLLSLSLSPPCSRSPNPQVPGRSIEEEAAAVGRRDGGRLRRHAANRREPRLQCRRSRPVPQGREARRLWPLLRRRLHHRPSEQRSQTTKGIWIAKGVGIEPCTIVLDLDGTNGRERVEDDTAFEKQSALFALAISDIVLINMWCHDIGREHAANRPLLKMVFQAMMRLFSPRKTTLLFVIRDKTKTPLEHLEQVPREDIQKIWDTVYRPQAHKETPLSEFFNVEVTALPSYEEKEELFKEQVAQLRQRFFHSIAPGGLAGDRRGVVPASGFSISIQQIWKVIRENKDLDLPAHKIMVATVRCEEIANEKLRCLTLDKGWLELEASVQAGSVSGFGRKLDSILDAYLSEYDMETLYFDDGVRTAKRQQLVSKALHLVHPAFQAMLGHLRSKALDKFKNDLEQLLESGKGFAMSVRTCTKASLLEFDTEFTDVAIKHADWNASKIRGKLCHDIEAHAASVRGVKLSELKASYEKKITEALVQPVESLFDSAAQDI